eukprot:SAG11_NODE_14200_length_621_cov_25.082375_1_plen_79_part_10
MLIVCARWVGRVGGPKRTARWVFRSPCASRAGPRGLSWLGELAVLCKGLPGSVDSHVQARVIKTIESWNAAGFYSEVKS